MIPRLRDYSIQVRRFRYAHRALHEFCHLLYGCRAELGEFASNPAWRRFVEQVWDFHNRSMVSPLRLSEPSLLSEAEAHFIVLNAGAIELRYPAAATLVGHVRDAIAACRASPEPGLADAMALVEDGAYDVVLVGCNDETFVDVICDSLGRTPPLGVLSRRAQQRARERLRAGVKGLVLGKLAHVEPSLLRAPLGDMTLDVLQYDWVQDVDASGAGGPTLAALREGDHTGPSRHLRVEDRVVHATETGGADPGTILEVRPFEGPDLWTAFQSVPGSVDDDRTAVPALLTVLSGPDRELLATLLQSETTVDVVRGARSGRALVADDISPLQLRPGDLLITRGDPEDQEAISSLGLEMLKERGLAESAARLTKEWKQLLQQRIEASGLSIVTHEIASRCSPWRPQTQHVENWADESTLGPQQKQAFRAVCAYLGVSDVRTSEYWRAIKTIHNMRIAAGRALNKRMLDQVLLSLAELGAPVNRSTTLENAGRAVTIYPVEFIARHTQDVPVDWIFPRRIVPIQPLDLEDLLFGPRGTHGAHDSTFPLR